MKWLMAIPVWSTPRDSLNRFNLVFSRCPYEESPFRPVFSLQGCRNVIACSPDSPYGDVISPKELDPNNEIVVSWRKAVQDWRDHWFGLTATPLLYADSMQAVDTFLGNEMMWAIVPLAAARTLAQAGRARICHLTDPAPDRVSYLMTRRGEALSPAAQLLLEDIRTEIQRIEGVHMVQ